MDKKVERAKERGWIPYLVYMLLSIAILGPLLSPGYILTLDMAFAPAMDFTTELWGLQGDVPVSVPFHFLLQLGNRLMPTWLLQKIILFSIFFFSGLGAYRLLSSKGIGSYFAGLLYAVNPFTYVRFMAGQWGVLATYAVTPFALSAFIKLLQNEGQKGIIKDIIKVALLSTLVGMMEIQGYLLLFLAFAIVFLGYIIKERKQPVKVGKAIKSIGLAAVLFCLLNVYWLVPVLNGGASFLEQFGQADLVSFTPKATSRIMFDIASMYGFWRGGYVYVQHLLSFWWLLFIFLLFLSTYGFMSKFGDRSIRWIVTSFVATAVLSFLMAVGASSNLTLPFFQWLWEHLSLIRGFRDSQKFVALLCLSYAYLGGLGVAEFSHKIKTEGKRSYRLMLAILVAMAVLTPLAYSFTMFGFYGQLGTTEYPKEWYAVNNYLNDDKDEFSVLFLPWHQYLDFGWLPNIDKRLVNPARTFFDKPIIQGDNVEMPSIYSQSSNPVSKYVEFVLAHKNVDNLGELLAPLNVKYVILVHEVDYENYAFLYQQKDLRVQIEKPGITVFENTYPRAQVYAVNNVVHVKSLDEFIELSRKQDVMAHLYILGSGTDEYSSAAIEKPDFTIRSPVKYEITATSNRYVIFPTPQNVNSAYWQYKGRDSLKNLGFIPAFESSPNNGEIIYTRFYNTYLPSYIISAVALISLLALWYGTSHTHKANSAESTLPNIRASKRISNTKDGYENQRSSLS